MAIIQLQNGDLLLVDGHRLTYEQIIQMLAGRGGTFASQPTSPPTPPQSSDARISMQKVREIEAGAERTVLMSPEGTPNYVPPAEMPKEIEAFYIKKYIPTTQSDGTKKQGIALWIQGKSHLGGQELIEHLKQLGFTGNKAEDILGKVSNLRKIADRIDSADVKIVVGAKTTTEKYWGFKPGLKGKAKNTEFSELLPYGKPVEFKDGNNSYRFQIYVLPKTQ